MGQKGARLGPDIALPYLQDNAQEPGPQHSVVQRGAGCQEPVQKYMRVGNIIRVHLIIP